MVGSFARWVDFKEEVAEMRSALQRAVARFRNAAMLGAFRRWVEFTQESGELRSALQRAAAWFRNAALPGRDYSKPLAHVISWNLDDRLLS